MRSLLRQGLQFMRAMRTPVFQRQMLASASPMEVSSAVALVVSPHHDDETFGCGGLIALKRRAGIDVHVVFITDGSASHGQLQGEALAALLQHRRDEALRATGLLGVEPGCVHFLDLPDGQLPGLSPARRDQAVALMAQLITSSGAGEIFVCRHDDRHPDHEATYRITREALTKSNSPARLLEYPIWILWLTPLLKFPRPGQWAGGLKLDVSSVRPVKAAASAVYHTQHQVLPRGFVEQFAREYELFFPAPGADATGS